MNKQNKEQLLNDLLNKYKNLMPVKTKEEIAKEQNKKIENTGEKK